MSQENTIRPQIESKLESRLNLHHLEVINESHKHNVPPGSESHFKIIAVSDDFDGKRLIARHRTINQILAHELADYIHALAIHCYTKDEWNEKKSAPDSPMCMGGGH